LQIFAITVFFISSLSEILPNPNFSKLNIKLGTTTAVACTSKAWPVRALLDFETLPDRLIDRISWFLTAHETAQVANSSHVCRKFLKPALSYCWEVFVDSKKHTVSNIYR
jgi:hypothetical protein